jgi:hypothetical protein
MVQIVLQPGTIKCSFKNSIVSVQENYYFLKIQQMLNLALVPSKSTDFISGGL